MSNCSVEDIKKAINLLLNNDVEYDSIIELYIDNNIDYKIVEDLFIFIPLVFCRVMLPQVNFPKTFIEIKENKKESRIAFNSLPIYNLILKVVNEQLPKYSSNDIIKIAAMSSEFKVINDLLLKEGENNNNLLNEMKLTELIINR